MKKFCRQILEIIFITMAAIFFFYQALKLEYNHAQPEYGPDHQILERNLDNEKNQ